MSDSTVDRIASMAPSLQATARAVGTTAPKSLQLLATLAMVAVATLLAFIVQTQIGAPNLTLIFVLPVIVAGTAFGFGPALVAVLTGVLAFDFFFTPPYFSFRIASPSDVWAAGLLLVIAMVVTTVAANARRRALDARIAAERAEALQELAHVVVAAKSRAELVRAAAQALEAIFRAPAVIFVQDRGQLRRLASAGSARIAVADEDAARGAFAGRIHIRGETYPYDESAFEFWPVGDAVDGGALIGVDFSQARRERPEHPEHFVDVVAAYLAAALRRA